MDNMNSSLSTLTKIGSSVQKKKSKRQARNLRRKVKVKTNKGSYGQHNYDGSYGQHEGNIDNDFYEHDDKQNMDDADEVADEGDDDDAEEEEEEDDDDDSRKKFPENFEADCETDSSDDEDNTGFDVDVNAGNQDGVEMNVSGNDVNAGNQDGVEMNVSGNDVNTGNEDGVDVLSGLNRAENNMEEWKRLDKECEKISYDGWDIEKFINTFIENRDRKINDNRLPLYNGSNVMANDFSDELAIWLSRNSVPILEQDKLVAMLDNNVPIVNWPVRKTLISNKIKSTANLSEELCERYLCVHTCSQGCMAFAGKNDTLTNCLVCNKARYKQGGSTPIKRLHLLPIIPKLIQLICTKNFVEILSCRREKYASSSNDFYSDVFDGILYKDAMSSMRDQFNKLKAKENNETEIVEISLCASIFYDGISLFKSNLIDFNPVEITILNLPPCFRHEFGTMFCAGVMTSKCGDGVETFFMKYCLLPELQLLYKGYTFEYQNKVYIIQMRLIVQDLDLKAWEKFFNVEQCNSRHGCPLCASGFRGRYCEQQKRIILNGTTKFLPLSNFNRFIGSRHKCCPEGFYNSKKEYNENSIDHIDLNSNYCYPLPKATLKVRPCTDTKYFCDKLKGRLPDEEYTLEELNVKNKLNTVLYVKLDVWRDHYNKTGWPTAYSKHGSIDKFYVPATVTAIHDITFTQIIIEIQVFNIIMKVGVTDKYLYFTKPADQFELDEDLYKTGERMHYDRSKKETLRYGFDEDLADRTINSDSTFFISGTRKVSVVHEYLHSDARLKDIKTISHRQHCDFRPQVKIKIVSHEKYIQNGMEALRMKLNVNSARKLKKVNYDGIKGISFMCYLPYYKYNFNKFEPAHAIKNVIMVILEHFNGDVTVSPAYKAIAEKYNMYKIVEVQGKKKKTAVTAPWILSPTSKNICDSFINSIMLPTGYKNNGAYYVFQQRGLLDTAACIQLATSPFLLYGLCTSACAIPNGYKYFLAMFIRDISDLLSPIMTLKMVEDVKMRLYELVSVKENIFPDTASRITFHQVIHLVEHVELSGPVGTNTGMSGERQIGKSKRFKTLGGSNPTGTIVRRTESAEKNAIKIYDPDDTTGARKTFLEKDSVKRFYNAERNVYTEFPFKILKPEKKSKEMGEFERDELVKACIKEVRKQIRTKDAGLLQSGLYRLHTAFTFKQREETSLPKWIFKLFDFVTNGNSGVGDGDINYMGIIIKIKECNVQLLRIDSFESTVLLQDLISVHTFLTSSFIVGIEGIIFGERFRCRGHECSEIQKSADGRVTNENNILSNHSMEKKNYSSWVNYRTRKLLKDDRGTYLPNQTFGPYKNWQFELGQLNYFFRVKIEGDTILNNVPFASIVPRISSHSNFDLWDYVGLTKPTLKTLGAFFIPASDIRPTALGVGFLDKDFKACLINHSRHSNQAQGVLEKYSTDCKPVKLALLPLNMTRDYVVYSELDNHIYNFSDTGTI